MATSYVYRARWPNPDQPELPPPGPPGPEGPVPQPPQPELPPDGPEDPGFPEPDPDPVPPGPMDPDWPPQPIRARFGQIIQTRATIVSTPGGQRVVIPDAILFTNPVVIGHANSQN